MPENLTSVTINDSGARVVQLRGDLDLTSAAGVGQILEQDFDVLDFSELEFLDSSGLRVLLQACRDRPKRPIARGLSGQVRRILDLTGLAEMFEIDEAEPPDAAPTSLA